jgi:Skp family chaperone for outer membrane proteins
MNIGRLFAAMVSVAVMLSAQAAENPPGYVNWVVLMREHPATAGWENQLYAKFQPRSAPIERKKTAATDLRATLELEGASFTPQQRVKTESELRRLEAEIAADEKAVVADFEIAYNWKVQEFYGAHGFEVQQQVSSLGYTLVIPDNVLNTDQYGVPKDPRIAGATDLTARIAGIAKQAYARPVPQAVPAQGRPSGKSPETVAREERERREMEVEQARRHERDCASSLQFIEDACSATTGKASLNAAACVLQQSLYRSMKCDEDTLAATTADAQRKLVEARTRERESAAAAAQANLDQIRNSNACASAESVCRQNANLCADARRAMVDSGASCPNFDFVASQATANLQMRQQEAARAEEERRAEQRRLEEQRLDEQRRLADSQRRQRAEQLAAANQAAARAESRQRQTPAPAASSGTFSWTHFDRYTQTQGADRMNYAVFIQNTGSASIRCGGNVQGQPAGTGVPRVSPYNIPIEAGQTREIAYLQNIVNGTGSYDVNCRTSN